MLSHDALAESLAGHLRSDRRMTWCDVQLGPSGSVRPDVYAIYKSFSNPLPMAYECKVSQSDFRSDVTSGKWQSYLRFAAGVVFACEGSLLNKDDVPAHCGLIVLRGDSWRAAKRPVLSPVIIPEEALLKLLIDGVEREGPRYRAKHFSDSRQIEQVSKKFGQVVARAVQNRVAVEYEIEQARHTAERIEADARFRADQIRTEALDLIAPIRAELCDILGLPPDTRHWNLKKEVQKLKAALAEHPAMVAHRTMTHILARLLQSHGFKDAEDVTRDVVE